MDSDKTTTEQDAIRIDGQLRAAVWHWAASGQLGASIAVVHHHCGTDYPADQWAVCVKNSRPGLPGHTYLVTYCDEQVAERLATACRQCLAAFWTAETSAPH